MTMNSLTIRTGDGMTSLRTTGTIVTLRLTRAERTQLTAIARQDGDTMSECIREALYQTYGIGGFTPSSPSGQGQR